MEKMEIVTIPDGQTKIAKNAFRWRRSLYGVIIPDSVKIIEKNAFIECVNLQNIIMPDSVTSIEKYAFYGCKKLQSVTMSANIKSIGDYAFYGCKSLTSIVLPDSLKSIGNYAFYGCKNLISITLPDSLTSIGNYVFSWCRKLTVYCSDSQKLVEAYCRKNKIKIQILNSANTEVISKKDEAPVSLDRSIADISDITKKIDAFISEINLFENSVADTVFSNELIEIKSILAKIIALLKEEKDAESRSRQLGEFANYYFPTIKKILDTYSHIETQNVNVDSAVETKQRIAEIMPFIKKAFEKELENLYENKMLDITTDIDVLESMFAKDGLLDENPFGVKKL